MFARFEELIRDAPDTATGFAPLRFLTAQLLLMTALDAVLGGDGEESPEPTADDPWRSRLPTSPARLAQSVVAPLAAAAHLAHVSRPSHATEVATRVLDTAVVGIAVGAATAGLVIRRGRERARMAAPLALATAGVLGLVLDRQERLQVRKLRRLARRASVVERLVPARRARLDHIVVHV